MKLINKAERAEGYSDIQPANIPFLPLLEKVAERFVLYGVLSLLNRTCIISTYFNGDVGAEERWKTHISIDSVNHVLRW